MIDPVPAPALTDDEPHPGEPVEGDSPGAGTMSRAEAIEQVAAALVKDGQPPTTAKVLATIYMTSDELSRMLEALDAAGGLPGIGGLLGSLFKRRSKGEG